MRLIDADVHECWACVHNNCGFDTWCEYGEEFELREDVKNAPTIEAVPVGNIKRIVERLEEAKFPQKFGGKTEMMILADKAIEIVKEGGGLNE